MKKGEIWIIELPFVEGREQRGKRPALILADTKTRYGFSSPFNFK